VPRRDPQEGQKSSSLAASACAGDATSSPEADRSLSSRLRQKAQETDHEVSGVAAPHKTGQKTQVQTTNLARPAV
jgi:hypothetical protein